MDSRPDFKAVVALILGSKYHAVREKEVLAALKGIPLRKGVEATPAQVLLSMVEWKVLFMRPYFKRAKDVPREAFWRG